MSCWKKWAGFLLAHFQCFSELSGHSNSFLDWNYALPLGRLGFQLRCVENQSSLEYFSGQTQLKWIPVVFKLKKNKVKGSLDIFYFELLWSQICPWCCTFANLLQFKDNCSHNGLWIMLSVVKMQWQWDIPIASLCCQEIIKDLLRKY